LLNVTEPPKIKEAGTAMKVLCASIRERGVGEFAPVAMMQITRKTITRDYVVFRGQVRASFPGHIEFRFDAMTVRKNRVRK
jgi:hypothetical protein